MSLFSAVGSGVPSIFPNKKHPLKPPQNAGSASVQTNKFYDNFLLGDGTLPAYPHPYSVWWTNTKDFYGLGVSHVPANQRVFGPKPDSNPAQFYFNPVKIMSFCFSAEQFENAPQLSTSAWGPLSVTATLSANGSSVSFPIVNGMGFVTGIYSGLKPLLSSQVGFKTVEKPVILRRGLSKLKVLLENNVTWLIYVLSPSGNTANFNQKDPQHIGVESMESPLIVQATIMYDQNMEAVADSAAGAYPVSASLGGGVTQDYDVAKYSIDYQLQGGSTGGGTLVYALPHHVDSFTSTMNGKVTNFTLDSTVMGPMRLCVTNTLEMYERLPRDVGFLPWTVQKPAGDDKFNINNFSANDINVLAQLATSETNLDLTQATNLNSMYFSGKAIDKYAFILLVAKYIIRDNGLAQSLLKKLQAAFQTFTSNKQQTPLCYDTDWKGIISQAGLTDPMADFGNTYYNDHHFHYGYFIHAAAVVGKVDKEFNGTWTKDNADWVNALVRDVASFGDDSSFPTSRNFDWFQGHSLAHGLFAAGDGKDEESSSEDYHCFYGMKLWASVIGDKNLEARSNLILAIERRAMGSYFLYLDNNTVEPKQIIPNKVSGIKFENKIDHTTYFGTNLEYIQGIHMIPITPISSFIRSPDFVQQEWNELISKIVDNVDSGWKSILQLNRALYDAKDSAEFFASSSFQAKWLDDGLSHTWALAFSKGVI